MRHAWIYGGMCEIRPPVYSSEKDRGHSRMSKGFKRRIWGFEETRGFHRRTEGFKKERWFQFPRSRGGFREGQRCFKNEGGFQKGLVVSEESKGVQRRTAVFQE